jgi:hypothetical protein
MASEISRFMDGYCGDSRATKHSENPYETRKLRRIGECTPFSVNGIIVQENGNTFDVAKPSNAGEHLTASHALNAEPTGDCLSVFQCSGKAKADKLRGVGQSPTVF